MNQLNGNPKMLSRRDTVAKPHHRVMLRGGRLRKTVRGVVTYAPCIGMPVAAAMGAVVVASGDASAQLCAGPETIVLQSITEPFAYCFGSKTGRPSRTITVEPGHSLRITGNAFLIDGLAFSFYRGQPVDYNFGNLTITVNRNIVALKNTSGGSANADGTGKWAGDGIYSRLHRAKADEDKSITIKVAGVAAGEDGLELINENRGSMAGIFVTTTGIISATRCSVPECRIQVQV